MWGVVAQGRLVHVGARRGLLHAVATRLPRSRRRCSSSSSSSSCSSARRLPSSGVGHVSNIPQCSSSPNWGLWIVGVGTPAALLGAALHGGGANPSEPGHEDATSISPAVITTVEPPVAGFFSKKLVVWDGIHVRAHADVSDEALWAVREQLRPMLSELPRAVLTNLRHSGAEVRVLGKDQLTTELPDMRHWRGKIWEKSSGKTLDERARGLGGICCVCAEENLLALPTDRHKDHRRICVHEFAHVIHRVGLDAALKRGITHAYDSAVREAGLWGGCYAATNEREFFAETSMWFFGSRGDYGELKPCPSAGCEWLESYDPGTFRFLQRVYSPGPVQGRRVKQLAHRQLLPRRPCPRTAATIAAQLRPVPARHRPQGRYSWTSSRWCVHGGRAGRSALTLDNLTESSYRIWWVNYRGERQAMGILHPAEKKGIRTTVGHSFVLTKWCPQEEEAERAGRGELGVVAAFTAEGQSCRAVVRHGGAPPYSLLQLKHAAL